jgi:hypothetical protein
MLYRQSCIVILVSVFSARLAYLICAESAASWFSKPMHATPSAIAAFTDRKALTPQWHLPMPTEKSRRRARWYPKDI